MPTGDPTVHYYARSGYFSMTGSRDRAPAARDPTVMME
jgi:hypothetical protein